VSIGKDEEELILKQCLFLALINIHGGFTSAVMKEVIFRFTKTGLIKQNKTPNI